MITNGRFKIVLNCQINLLLLFHQLFSNKGHKRCRVCCKMKKASIPLLMRKFLTLKSLKYSKNKKEKQWP